MDRACGMNGGVQNKQVLIDTQRKPHFEDLSIDGMGSCEHLSDCIKLWKILTSPRNTASQVLCYIEVIYYPIFNLE